MMIAGYMGGYKLHIHETFKPAPITLVSSPHLRRKTWRAQTNEENVTYSTKAWGIHVIVKIFNLKSMQLQKYHEFGQYLDIM